MSEHQNTDRTEAEIKFLRQELMQAMDEREIVLVHTDSNSLNAGFISQVYEDDYVLNHIRATGRNDGYIVHDIEDITIIEKQGHYVEKLKKLWQLYGQAHPEIKERQASGYATVLKHAYQNQKIVSVELSYSDTFDVIGLVSYFDGSAVKVRNVDDNGVLDSESTFFIKDITHLVCDGEEQRQLKELIDFDK